MDTRKVQLLGPTTLAVTLPAEWAKENGVEKGDEVTVHDAKGSLRVETNSQQHGSEATIYAAELGGPAVERAVIAQYVLGRRIIRVTSDDGALGSETIDAIYAAEEQLMGVGIVEESLEQISLRCSVDTDDFSLDNLLERLEATGRTLRNEAIKSIARETTDPAHRAMNREKQANKIFVLLLRLIFTVQQDATKAPSVGLSDSFPLIGYRSIAKNLELTADAGQDLADIALEAEEDGINIDGPTMRRIRDLADELDDITQASVAAAVERDYDLAIEVREWVAELADREEEILSELSETSHDEFMHVREILISLAQIAEYATRNAEIAANIALADDSKYVDVD
jgi:phosphate uptake regulator